MIRHQNKGSLVLEDGSVFEGHLVGHPQSTAGELVFNTGLVGYPESLTDPSYNGQILVQTYPLIGNYGVRGKGSTPESELAFESARIQIAGLIVSEMYADRSHWSAERTLPEWLAEEHVPALAGIDTRALTKRLRSNGSLLAKIVVGGDEIDFYDPNRDDLMSRVSTDRPRVYSGGDVRIVVVDCGCKNSIIRNLVSRGATVIRVPHDYDLFSEEFHGVVISNGPGDPKMCASTVSNVRRAMEKGYPMLGICLGNQIMALAAGAETYKLKYGHRGQNQPCIDITTGRCYMTSQNHGFAVDDRTLIDGWEKWFVNANDQTNEGIRHRRSPFLGVQFHPEGKPGPVDTAFVFDEFLGKVLAS